MATMNNLQQNFSLPMHKGSKLLKIPQIRLLEPVQYLPKL